MLQKLARFGCCDPYLHRKRRPCHNSIAGGPPHGFAERGSACRRRAAPNGRCSGGSGPLRQREVDSRRPAEGGLLPVSLLRLDDALVLGVGTHSTRRRTRQTRWRGRSGAVLGKPSDDAGARWCTLLMGPPGAGCAPRLETGAHPPSVFEWSPFRSPSASACSSQLPLRTPLCSCCL